MQGGNQYRGNTKNKIHQTYSLGDDFVHKFVHAVNFELEIIKAMLN